MANVDIFTIENILDGLIAASDEMFISWGRTSQSTIIYEVLDYAAGLTDANGNLIAQSNGVTGFLGTITYSVKSVIEKFGHENIYPGDIILTNDPYNGSGTHLCDVSAVMPVFYEGEIVAFAANKGHWNEIGGKSLGSWCTDSTEIYQEGLQFPIIKVYEKGKLNEAIRDMIEANVRTPKMTLGDLYAQTASLRVAERRIMDLCSKYGKEAVIQSIEKALEDGEKLAKQQLAKLPHGVFEAESFIDTESNNIDDVYIKAKVTINEDEFIIDLTGSGEQVPAPINCTKYGAYSAARVVYRAIVCPHAGNLGNEGFYKPLKLIVPDGTVFSAVRPAPVSCNWEAFSHITDLVAMALAPQIPERISAGHFLSIIGTIVGGIDDRTGEVFVLSEPQAGGWGAGINKDGESGLVAIDDGETYIIPVEVAETKYPLIVEQFKLNTGVDKSGIGKFRGGYGLIRDYRIDNSNAELTTVASRYRYLPWGIDGGKEGSNNKVQTFVNEKMTEKATFSNKKLGKNDLIRFISGGGGGYGDPFERDPQMVLDDVLDDYISIKEAKEYYGVVIEEVDGRLEINKEKTEAIRRNV